jgi:hypothetical protein
MTTVIPGGQRRGKAGSLFQLLPTQQQAEQGLGERYAPARRWLAVFWSAAMDDPALDRWCRLLLLA